MRCDMRRPQVYAVIDASGDMSEVAQRAAMERMAQAGILTVTTQVVLAELQRTWARPDSARWGRVTASWCRTTAP